MRRADCQAILSRNRAIRGPISISNASVNKKFLEKTPFNKTDMRECSEPIIYRIHPGVVFEATDNISELQNFFSELETKEAVVVHNCGNKHWVLLCVREKNDDGSVEVWYKDPAGRAIPFDIQNVITHYFPENLSVLIHTNTDITEEDLPDFGPVCLSNLEKVLNLMDQDSSDSENFSDVHFCTEEDVKIERLNRMMKTYLPNLAKNVKFKKALREFMGNLPLELAEEFDIYINVLKEEEDKSDQDRDIGRIDKARNDLYKSERLEKLIDDFPLKETRVEKVKHKVYSGPHKFKIKIEEKFPDEMNKLRALLELIESFKFDDQLKTRLTKISDMLQIDCNRFMKLYDGRQTSEEEDDQLVVPTPAEIAQNLTFTEGSLENSSGDTVEEFLQHFEGNNQNYRSFLEEIEEFKVEFGTYSIEYIQNWASSCKGNLEESEICKAIAIVNQAIKLTNGYYLRITQIQALLIFLHKERTSGKLCQIQTGEGKTVIVAALAAIKVLQGHIVDVLTSNSILATEGVNKMKNFYNTMALTVETNNDEGGASRKGYRADVLYSTINNLQFDFLREALGENNVRFNRKFDVVILDEVDSMLVDNGGHIAKISSPFPGMESLRYVYIKIWEELSRLTSDPNLQRDAVLQRLKPKTENCLKCSPFTELIPNHLKKFVESQTDVWIENALRAHFDLREHHHYRLMKNATEEVVIVPVDYSNTGVSMKNTIWCSGLHQFVQLKHHLQLTYESLTSCYISNIAYIGKYQHSNIFGMTGTLGSTAEQELLGEIYDVSFDKIPTFKKKVFKELNGVVYDDKLWQVFLADNVVRFAEDGRAVLVICETEEQVMRIEDALSYLQNDYNFCLKQYTNEETSSVTNEKLEPGDIVLATNIAGRGTDFQTSDALENNGGLHVCIGFLPYNKRVEDQACGRTSRQGNKGTAQLVIPKSDVTNMGIDTEDFVEIKRFRDARERVRLHDIREVRIKELQFKDDLFTIFGTYYEEVKLRNEDHLARAYYLKDLVEFFAFWLYEMERSTVELTAEAAFEDFKREYDSIAAEGIGFNPYYCIEAAKLHLKHFQKKEAAEMLQRTLRMCGENPALTYGAHVKMADLIITSADAVRLRLKTAFKKFIFMDEPSDGNYKNDAASHLSKAKKALEVEIKYLKDLIYFDNFSDTETSAIVSVGEFRDVQRTAVERPDDAITTSEEASTSEQVSSNRFLKHINGRLAFLRFHLNHVDKLLENIKSLTEDRGVAVLGRIDSSDQSLYTENNIDPDVFKTAIVEMRNIGLDTLLSLKEVHDIPNEKIRFAQAHIGIAVSALIAGCLFPPAIPFTNTIAITLIMDTVVDLVIELICKGVEGFQKTSFYVGKGITYLTAALTMGFSYIVKCTKLIENAIKFCQRAAALLRRSTYLPQLCSKLAAWLESFAFILEQVLYAIRATTTVVETVEKVCPAAITVAENVAKPAISVATSRLCTAAYFKVENYVTKVISDLVKENDYLRGLLGGTSFRSVTKQVEDFCAITDESEPLVKQLKLMLPFEEFDMRPVGESPEFLNFARQLCDYLQQHLQEAADEGDQLTRIIRCISFLVSKHLMTLKIMAMANVNQ